MSALILPRLPAREPAEAAAMIRELLSRRRDDVPESHVVGRLPVIDSDRPAWAAAALDAAHLVSEADGISAQEARAFEHLAEQLVSDPAARASALTRLEHAVQLPLPARLAEIAGAASSFAERERLLSMAVLVALADGQLSAPEAGRVVDLGLSFGFSVAEAQRVVDSMAAEIRGFTSQ